MRAAIQEHTVPGTDVQIVVEFDETDPKLAALLKDRPGTGKWIDRWFITRHPGTASFVNYLHTSRTSRLEAQTEVNFLWNDTITRLVRHQITSSVPAGRPVCHNTIKF